MKMLVCAVFFLFQCSCSEAGPGASLKTGVGTKVGAKTSPQGLPLKTLVFSNGVRLQVEFAATPASRQKGLMNRDQLEEKSGMLFKFDWPHVLSFWMKNTYIPLEIGFFTKDKKLVNTLVMKPQVRGPVLNQDLRSYQSIEPCIYALEVNPNWFSKNKVEVGSTFRLL